MNFFRRRIRRPLCRKPSVRRFESLEGRDFLSANVLNYRYDQSGTGVNTQETTLTPGNVNAATFGKLSTTPVDGQVYAEPLYVAGVNISGGIHSIVYVATEHDSVYAIDANSGTVLWHESFLSAPGVSTVPWGDTGSPALQPELGITATPVIDPSTNSIYVLANTKEVRGDGAHYVYKLHALDLQTGAENLGGPLTIADTICNDPTNPITGGDYTYVSGPTVNGTGTGSVNGKLTFNALRELGRVALTEVNGNIYMAFGSHPDVDPAHGWVLGVNAQSMSLSSAICLTPNGDLGDAWQSGDAFAVDSDGDLIVTTGNGTFDTTLNAAGFPVNGDYGDSIVKIAVDPTSTAANPNINGWGLKVVDYFTPSNQQVLADQDLDLGSGGAILLPPSAGSSANPNLMIQGGKEGKLYLFRQDGMGEFNPNTDQVVQEASGLFTNNETPPTGVPLEYIFSAPSYFNGTLYYATLGDHARAFSLTNGKLSTTPSSVSTDTFGYPGATPTITANGTSNGIVWMIDPGTNELRAYDAGNLAHELYNSDQAAGTRDKLGTAVKFTVPTVADGHVFVGTSNSLVIYGLLGSSGNPGGNSDANAKYIASAYQDVLGRPVDAASLATWTFLLEHGTSRATFAMSLTHSVEYDHNIINADYAKYLGRSPDATGLNYWTSQIQNGLSDELLEALFIGSDEYYHRSGGTNKGWVDAMYQDLLGRHADPSGEAAWTHLLTTGASRMQVAYGFTGSAEREAARVRTDYSNYLQRQTSDADVAAWTQLFELGMSNETVIAGFVASDEYFAKHS
jgi:outer membrane protein assembly factor BamB